MGDTPYLVVPGQGKGPGVLVLHSWWGLNAFFRGFCDRLGREGFVVVAPDLYGGKVAATITEAKKLRAETTASRKEPAYKYLIRVINRAGRPKRPPRERTSRLIFMGLGLLVVTNL